jgi:hypothetical protein
MIAASKLETMLAVLFYGKRAGRRADELQSSMDGVMDLATIGSEVKTWQPLIGSLFGFGALTWGALYNFKLNRQRDDRLREMEGRTVALALYSEINMLRRDIAKLAVGIAGRFLRSGGYEDEVPSYFLELYPMPEPTLYAALAPKIGLLDADLLLRITTFYSNYLEVRTHLPKLIEDEDRAIHYGVGWVLRPALAAVEDVVPALRAIEAMGRIEPPAADPSIGKTKEALKLEDEIGPDE